MITIENVSKTFSAHDQSVQALRHISLSIEPGSWISITGPSGSGKSTLANIMSGILLPDPGGSCRFDHFQRLNGIDICSLNDQERSRLRASDIALTHQDFNLISYLNVIENVVLPDILSSKKPDWKRAEKALASVKLSDKLKSMPGELSGGQKLRTAIARALYSEAEILIADEPTGSLDEINRDEIIKIFHSIHQTGVTLIIITHDHYLASQAQKILHLEQGELV